MMVRVVQGYFTVKVAPERLEQEMKRAPSYRDASNLKACLRSSLVN